LKADVLPDFGVLGDRDVGVVEARTSEAEPTGVAEGADRRQREGSRVEVKASRIAGYRVAVSDEIGTRVYDARTESQRIDSLKTVKGRPVVEATMPLNCQPDTTRLRLKGRAHRPLTRNDCVMS